jgi:hypothetical protein
MLVDREDDHKQRRSQKQAEERTTALPNICWIPGLGFIDPRLFAWPLGAVDSLHALVPSVETHCARRFVLEPGGARKSGSMILCRDSVREHCAVSERQSNRNI